jgi:hypothetical protein
MVPLFIDNDFTDIVIEGVLRRYEHVDLIRAREVGLRRAHDVVLLEWAAANGRVTISHDKKSMTDAAHRRTRAALPMPGVVIVPQSLEYRTAIEDIAMVALCSEPGDWVDRVEYLPLVR